MGQAKWYERLREWFFQRIGHVCWRGFLWAIHRTEEEYWKEIYRQEEARYIPTVEDRFLEANVMVILTWMQRYGSSISLNFGEDTGLWEVSWITGGKRITETNRIFFDALRLTYSTGRYFKTAFLDAEEYKKIFSERPKKSIYGGT